MSQQDLLKKVVEVLDGVGIDYMVTGSVASTLYGEPRSTHDIDLVVAMPPAAVSALVAAFPPPAYFLSEESIRDALRQQSMFNLLALDEGDKIDFWILTAEPFDQTRFSRKRIADAWGMKLKMSAPEDVILAKLKWAQLSGGSEKQLRDALRVYEVQRGRLDLNYLETWASRLAVEPLWQQLKALAHSLPSEKTEGTDAPHP
jgi:hypothetical protein